MAFITSEDENENSCRYSQNNTSLRIMTWLNDASNDKGTIQRW